MVNTNFAQKPIWLNDDESVANVIYTPIDATIDFSVESFDQNFDKVEALRNAKKGEFSAMIFGDNRLESISDREFSTLQRNFNRDVVQEQFSIYTANKAPELISLVNQINPEQVERFILNKNRNAQTSTFKRNIPNNASDEQKESIELYNGAASAVDAYHVEIGKMEEVGDNSYVAGRLNNISDMQLAVIMAATGSRPGDASKIARSYKNFHAAKATEAVAKIGIASYVANNLRTAKQLETGHRAESTELEEIVENKIAALGPGASKENRAAVYKAAEASKEDIDSLYQHAGTDAKYLFTDLANKAREATTEIARYQAQAA